MELTSEQVGLFDVNGYLVVDDVFNAAEIDGMRAAADALLELLVNSSLANGRTSARLDLRAPKSGVHVVRKVQPFVDLEPLFARLTRDPRIVQPVAQMQRGEPELMEDKFSFKQLIGDPL